MKQCIDDKFVPPQVVTSLCTLELGINALLRFMSVRRQLHLIVLAHSLDMREDFCIACVILFAVVATTTDAVVGGRAFAAVEEMGEAAASDDVQNRK